MLSTDFFLTFCSFESNAYFSKSIFAASIFGLIDSMPAATFKKTSSRVVTEIPYSTILNSFFLF